MFMFWSKRTQLTKRLLKAKVRGEHETECEAQENHIIPYSNYYSTESHPPDSPCRSTSASNGHAGQFAHSGAASASALPISSSNSVIDETWNTDESSELQQRRFQENQSNAQNPAKRCRQIFCSNTERAAPVKQVEQHHNHNRDNRQNALPSDVAANGFDNLDNLGNRLARCKELLKSLEANQLEMLLTAVDSYGADLGACVLVPRRRAGRVAGDESSATTLPPFEDREDVREDQTEASMRISTATTTASEALGEERGPSRHHSHHHHHHYHHHHHHHHHHHYHQRRQRQQHNHNNDSVESIDKNVQETERIDSENIPLDERIDSTKVAIATTTTPRLCRGNRHKSRTSGNAIELPVDPHLLCCQIWRWPDLKNTEELKRLPVCHSAKDPFYICCNPYHWSRLCKPESPPPPYCLIADRLRPEDRAPSEGNASHPYDDVRNENSSPLPGSLTTNGEDSSGQREWCTLAYWELGGRVGRLYPVEPSTVNVFDSLLDGDGLCLATLAENHSTSPMIQKTRSKIGLGLMLSDESDGVWAYNRSENPIFVNSPTLDDPESRTLLVYRVPPGFCLNIFDRAKTLQLHRSYAASSLGCPTGNPAGSASGPVDVNSVRISFAKGWGPKYSRQEVTSCPCWLEVLLAPCR